MNMCLDGKDKWIKWLVGVKVLTNIIIFLMALLWFDVGMGSGIITWVAVSCSDVPSVEVFPTSTLDFPSQCMLEECGICSTKSAWY